MIYNYLKPFQAKETIDSAILVPLGTQMFWALVLSAIFCEVGERMSMVWTELDDEIKKINWYFLSTKMGKTVIITISFSQREVTLDGFGNISGSREIFKKVSLFQRLHLCVLYDNIALFRLVLL